MDVVVAKAPGAAAAAGALAAPIQGFIATHEAWIYGAAVALMAWGLYGSARRVLSCDVRGLGAPGAIHGRAGECCGNEAALPSRNLR
jgi:hypothetical protein